MLEPEKISYDLSLIKEESVVINNLKEDIQDQKKLIEESGNILFFFLALQSIFTIPPIVHLFIPFTPLRGFLTFVTLASIFMFLLYSFTIKEIHKNEDSWFFKLFSKRKKIVKLKNLQEQCFILISELAIQFENTSTQESILDYLEKNQQFVPVDKIESYQYGMSTLKSYFHTKNYQEAAELVADLIPDINLQYINPYFNKNTQSEPKIDFAHYFKKHL